MREGRIEDMNKWEYSRFYTFGSHTLTEDEKQLIQEDNKKTQERQKKAVLYMNTWTKQSKLDYLLNYEYKDYHQQDEIDWITKIGLNEAFRFTYELFGDDDFF